MVCGKCKHEFCWLCLAPFYSYSHGENRYCPFRYTALTITMIILIFSLNQKLAYFSEWYFSLEWFILSTLTAGILVDLVVFSFGVYLPIIGGLCEVNRKRMYEGRLRCCPLVFLIIGAIFSLSFHGTFIYLSCFSDNWPYLYYMVKCLFWEVIFIIVIAVIVLVFYIVREIYRRFSSVIRSVISVIQRLRVKIFGERNNVIKDN